LSTLCLKCLVETDSCKAQSAPSKVAGVTDAHHPQKLMPSVEGWHPKGDSPAANVLMKWKPHLLSSLCCSTSIMRWQWFP